MYSIKQIKEMQINEEYFINEGDKYCLVKIIPQKIFTKQDVENQANFCILQIIKALKEDLLSKEEANNLLNKIDALEYSTDMIGTERVIKKLNKEIIEEELHIPYFNSLCVLCSDLYDIYE